MRLRGAVFDIAGTLLDPGSQAPLDALARTFKKACGVTVPRDVLAAAMGQSKWAHFQHVARAVGVPAAEHRALFRDVYLPLQFHAVVDRAVWIPGVLAAVRRLSRDHGVRIACTTGYTGDLARPLWEKFMRDRAPIEMLVTTDRVFTIWPLMSEEMIDPPLPGRPSAAMMGVIQREWGMPVAAVVKVGDTVVDIAEGRSAGARTIGVTASGVSSMGGKEGEADMAREMTATGADATQPDVASAVAWIESAGWL